MFKTLTFLIILLPLGCFAQVTISGKVLNQVNTRPVAYASVFLSNATIGSKTADDGTFTLHGVKPGKYEMVISIIGFENYSQTITVENGNITLPDILIFPKTTLLNEVTVKPVTDPDRGKNYDLFKNEFLGTSELAKECKILNPEVLDLDYNEATNTLTASSVDFLKIENDALGYRIKYLLTNFSFENNGNDEKRIYYKGPVLFEELKGTPSQERRWQKNRDDVYENSPRHFLRAALNNRINEEGFRVQQYIIYANPERPSDSLINARIKFYQDLKSLSKFQRDSLSFWVKKSKLPKTFQKLAPFALSKHDIIGTTDQPGQYALNCDNDGLYVAYSKNHHFHISEEIKYLYNRNNTENTLINFNQPEAFFNSEGIISNPYSVIFYGVWGRNRVAELLPIDYEPLQNANTVTEDNIAESIKLKLDQYSAVHPIEKAYVQFDKPYYAAGDTIYFKAYVTKGEDHRLSDQSGVLHVDLIDTKDKIGQSIKLQLDSGVAWGDFALPDSLPGGNYHIRAYTQWMRNEGETGFFDKVVPVGSLKITRIPESIIKPPGQSLNLKPDIQFFPEGGSLVTGIRSKTAFKAIGSNGLGIDVKGTIIDDQNNEVAVFSSAHLGMGYFYLTPAAGKTYKAKITYPNGAQAIIVLPKPGPGGIVLSVNNEYLPKATALIEVNPDYYRENKNKDYRLVIYSQGMVTAASFKLDSPVIRLDILKRKLHTGVATVTLFSPGNEPLCERLLFIQNYDHLDLSINGSKSRYGQREKMNIRLNAANRRGEPSEGHFSVSVIDETKVPEIENNGDNILTYFLLTSDLKGIIEQPGYYFADTSTAAAKHLDVLMLTQGYRRFTWKQVLDSAKQTLAYQAENGIEIAGQVTNLFNKPVANGTITLIPSKGGSVFSGTTNDKGVFRFSNLTFMDTAHFVLSAVNSKNKNSTRITYFNDRRFEPAVQSNQQQLEQRATDTAISAYVKNDKLQQKEVLNYLKGKGIMLKEVKIRDKKLDDQYRTQSLAGAGHADQVMHADEIERVEGPLITSLDGRLRGVTFVGSGSGPHRVPYLTLSLLMAGVGDKGHSAAKKMLLIIDGAEVNPDDINYLTASEVETVELLKYASASIYGMEGAGGVLIITTKQSRGLAAKNIASIGVLPIAPVGFYKSREFYSPKYDNTTWVTKQRDLRSTIFWKPEIQTDKDGNASFDYYNADGAGTYKVVVEGIDNNGNIGRQVYRYKVE